MSSEWIKDRVRRDNFQGFEKQMKLKKSESCKNKTQMKESEKRKEARWKEKRSLSTPKDD